MAMQPISDKPTEAHNETSLPIFILKEAEGVFVDLSQPIPDAALVQFIERLFSGGARFTGLDYQNFIALLYDIESFKVDSGVKPGKIRLASDIVRFPQQRRNLYKGLKILDDGARAEYFFGPVMLEEFTDEPVYGEPDQDGIAPIVDYIRHTKELPATPDFDEFVADMWLKGVRFGIDAEAVRKAIESGSSIRVEVACQLAPDNGHDAEMQAANEGLQRDDSPKVLANGRTDLTKFKNRFPHVAKGDPLVKKVHMVQGAPGRKVTGEIIEPPVPQDLDLYALAGPGTFVRQGNGEDYIVADIDGFLSLDVESNQVSVTEKIENRGGISVRTTGDLALAVDEFIEHGEVQEGRVVEGKHMTFKAAVYGSVSSTNGNIVMESNFSGSSAKSVGGNVTIHGRASCAVLEAWDGKITAQFAEGCTIKGKVVYIDRAIGCDIVAEELHIGSSEGCGIAAKSIRAGASNARKSEESVFTLVVPDLSHFDQSIDENRKALTDTAEAIAARVSQAEALRADPEFAKFQTLYDQIRQGRIQLTDAQTENWKRMENRFAGQLRQLQVLDAEKQVLLKRSQVMQEDIERLGRERRASGEGVCCVIDDIRGDTVVQTLISREGVAWLWHLPDAELKARLHSLSGAQDRLLFGSQGNFDWHFVVPELAAG